MPEIVELALPSKGSNESQYAYRKRQEDGRWSSPVASEAARKVFDFKEARGNEKGVDARDGSDLYEHKGMRSSAFCRYSSSTGKGRISYPTAVRECCTDKGFLITIITDVNRPFVVKVSPEETQFLVRCGYIDPVSGNLNRQDFFNWIRPFDSHGLVPSSKYSLEKTAARLETRLDAANILRRLKKTFSSWEADHTKVKEQVTSDIKHYEDLCNRE